MIQIMKGKHIFLLSWKKLWVIVITAFASIMLHNLISGLIKTEEIFFFIIVILIIPAYTLIAITYSLIHLVNTRKKQ